MKEVDVTSQTGPENDNGAVETQTLTKADFVSVNPSDEIEENFIIFYAEAQMAAIDFDDATKWKIKTKDKVKSAAVEDSDFLEKVANGLAISKDDIFQLQIREDTIIKNENKRTSWTVLRVEKHKKVVDEDDSEGSDTPTP